MNVNESLKAGETKMVHKFEMAGLGKAPFRFTGTMTEKVIKCGDTMKAGSSCDYCGTGIRYEFWVASSDNNTFKVGCDCIHKTGDSGLIKQISAAERKLRDMKNVAAKQRKAERLAVRVEAAKSKLNAVRGILSEQPHPSTYFANEGRTMLDYVVWCFDNRAEERASGIIERAWATR